MCIVSVRRFCSEKTIHRMGSAVNRDIGGFGTGEEYPIRSPQPPGASPLPSPHQVAPRPLPLPG